VQALVCLLRAPGHPKLCVVSHVFALVFTDQAFVSL
jgi:hypothetical protein